MYRLLLPHLTAVVSDVVHWSSGIMSACAVRTVPGIFPRRLHGGRPLVTVEQVLVEQVLV